MLYHQKPKIKKQLDWIAKLPASQAAERMLTLVKSSRAPVLPSVLALLLWAVEEAAPAMKLEVGKARLVLDDLIYWSMMGKPKAAVLILLNSEDPENEFPGNAFFGPDPQETALDLIALANDAAVH